LFADPNISTGLRTFVGEETNTPPSKPLRQDRSNSQPSDLSEQQQKQLLKPLISDDKSSSQTQSPVSPRPTNGEPTAANVNPLASFISSVTQTPKTTIAPGKGPVILNVLIRLQKLMPLAHLLLMWILLAYFVLIREPKLLEEQTHGSKWRRWSSLARMDPIEAGWRLEVVVSAVLNNFV
jgi:hypothetical protein